MKHISMRKAKWVGHILGHEGLLNTIIEGIERNVPRGRPIK